MARTSYKVKILDEQEWNELVKANPRFAHVDDFNLGFADRQTGHGYVREEFLKTFPGAKSYLLQHEFDHLVESEPSDVDEHGICHKKFFKQILAPIAAPFISPFIQKGFTGEALKDVGRELAATAGGFFTGGPIGAVTAASAQGLRNAAVVGQKDPLTGRSLLGAAGTGAGAGGVGTGIGNAFGLGGTGATTSGLSGLGRMLGGTPPPLTTSPGLGGAGTTGAPTAGLDSAASVLTGQGRFPRSPLLNFNVPQSLGNVPSAFGGAGGFQPFTPPPGGGGGGGNPLLQFLKNLIPGGNSASSSQSAGNQGLNVGQRVGLGLGATALGTGLATFGNRAKQGQPPEIPELSQVPAVQRFHTETQNRLGPLVEQLGGLTGQFQGLNPQIQGLQSQLAGLQNTPLPENLRASVTRPFDQELRDFYSQLSQYQPDANLTNNSAYLRGVGDINQRQAEALANAQLAFQGQQRQTIAQQLQGVQAQQGTLESQRNNILAQSGLTQEQLASFHELAQLDLTTIMARTGLSAQQAAQFRDVFGQLGGAVAGAGIMGAFGR